MNFRTVSIISIFCFLFVSPVFTLPLLDSHTLGTLAVPLISIRGSIVAGKIIGDYLEGKPVFGHNILVHTSFPIQQKAVPVLAGGHGKGLLLASPLHGLGALPLPFKLA